MDDTLLSLPFAPWRLSGTVVGALLNDAAELAALGDAAHRPPHGRPPVAPVLEVKPRHVLAADGAAVLLPADAEALQVGVSLGIVVGRTLCRADAAAARAAVAGFLVAADFSLPITAHYRPAVRLKARDGFCPLGDAVAAEQVADADALVTELSIDGQAAQRASTAGRMRNVAQLLADVSAFMTLQPGDLLLLGRGHATALVRAGQRVEARIDGVGRVGCHVVAEGGA